MADPWAGHYQTVNPWGDRDQALRQSGKTPAGYYQQMFNVPGGAGSTSWTNANPMFQGPLHRGAGMSGTTAAYNNPQTLKDFYSLEHNQRKAYLQANPNGLGMLANVNNQPMKDQGLGPGAATDYSYTGGGRPGVSLSTVSSGGTGGLPPINANEDSMAYMLRIGMSPADASAALAKSQANPGMSFQDIIAGANYGGAGAGGAASNAAPAASNAATNTGTLPPMNAGESSAAYMARIGMSQAQIQGALTLAQQNPGMSFQDIMAKLNSTPSTGGGAAPNTATGTNTGGYPAINAGEDSAAYMARIGMSPSQIQAALEMAKQNPGMSFQDIMARLNAGGGGGGSTGNIVDPGVTLGQVAQGQSSALGNVNGVQGYTGGGSFDINNWKDPGYDFRLKEGSDLLQGSAAAQGNLQSGPTLKALTKYGQDAASQEYEKAYGRFTGNRAFNYGVDVGDRAFDYLSRTGDRDFAYRAQTGDRDYNKDLMDMLIRAGEYGTTGGASANELLAKLISANTVSGGGASAAATIGGGNKVTDAISEWLKYIGGLNTVKTATG